MANRVLSCNPVDLAIVLQLLIFIFLAVLLLSRTAFGDLVAVSGNHGHCLVQVSSATSGQAF